MVNAPGNAWKKWKAKTAMQEETALFNFATNRDRDRSERRGRKKTATP